MTNEEVERNIRFVIEQQAQFAVNLQKIEEVQAKFGSEMQEMKDVVFTVVGMIGRLAETQKQTDERMGKLADAHTELAKAHKETDERLNTFIAVLERHVGGNDRLKRRQRKRSP